MARQVRDPIGLTGLAGQWQLAAGISDDNLDAAFPPIVPASCSIALTTPPAVVPDTAASSTIGRDNR